jgi:hypothetical protein
LTLAVAPDWTPNDVASLLRRADYDDGRKLDIATGGYVQYQDGIYLHVERNDALDALANAARLDLDEAFADADSVPPAGIRLCAVPDGLDLTGAPDASYPLVGTNVTVRFGLKTEHQWTLRALSNAQQKELARWRNVLRRKGRDYAFTVESLPPLVDAFIRLSLEDEAEEIAAVFETARLMLAVPETRAFSQTRAEFVSEMLAIIGRGQAEDVTRRKFAGEMRSALRRYGLVAFRDGMNEVGYDPESLGQDELNAFRNWLAEQSGFVSDFGVEVFREGISEAEVRLRAEMWASMSLEAARQVGMLLGAPEQMMEWVQGDTREPCDDCTRLNGQVHSMKAWIASGWTPTSRKTACNSYNCQCRLVPTDQDERGDF